MQRLRRASQNLSFDAIRDALAQHKWTHWPALPGRRNDVPAAILLPLQERGDDLSCVFTKRAETLRKHAGEICFPGGRPDASDEDMIATALRETYEEIGASTVDVLGRLSSIPLYTSDYRLEPFVGALPREVDFVLNGDEVSELVVLSVREVLSLEFIHGIEWTDPTTEKRDHAPVFESSAGLIFGGTAYAFYELLSVLAPLMDAEVPGLRAGRYQWSDVLTRPE